VHVPTAAWLLMGIGIGLVIVTLLLVFIIPSARRRRSPSQHPRRVNLPRFTFPLTSPAGSMVKGFSYLYAPLRHPRMHYSVSGRLQRAIGRVDAVDPSLADERVGQALQQMVELVSGPTESPVPEDDEPVVDIFDQPRNEEPT
jgi:hypothetical protein